MRNISKIALVGSAALVLSSVLTNAASLTAIDDNILLQNGNPVGTNTQDAEDNFGGRTEMIFGDSNGNARNGLFRFDVSSLALEINSSLPVTSATFTLTERSARNSSQPSGPTTMSLYAVAAGNAGWVEGTKAGSASGWSGEAGSSSFMFLSTPTALAATDGVQWLSAGGGATTGAIPSPSTFQFGTDTDATPLGSYSFTSTAGLDVWTMTLNPAAVQALLPQWLADGTDNAGLALESAGSGQWFAESVEGNAALAPMLDIQFAAVPEPATLGMLLAAGGILTVLRRRRK